MAVKVPTPVTPKVPPTVASVTAKLPATVVVEPAALAPPAIVNTVSTPPLSVQATPIVKVPCSLPLATAVAVAIIDTKL